jgi:autotransporter-associated beta strand protein
MSSPISISGRGTQFRRRCVAVSILIATEVLFPVNASAQVVWDNDNGNNRWGTGSNWSTNSVPTGTSDVEFNATDDNATVSDIQLRADRSANSLTFNNVNDNFGLIDGTGTRTLTLTSGEVTRTAGSSNTQNLSFTTLALGGDATMNIAGSGSLTINSAIVDSGGARSLTKTGAGELILAGANTFSGDTTISAGTLTLASISALGAGSTFTLNGGTLKLGTASTTVTNLNVTASSIIDFGGADATLNVTNFTIAVGVTLTIQNWANAADFFIAQSWTGAAFSVTGSDPMTQVFFEGYNVNDTKWQEYDRQITAVPEPSTYGAMLLGLGSALLAWRRRRK